MAEKKAKKSKKDAVSDPSRSAPRTNTQYEGMFLLGAGATDQEASINLVRGVIERHGGNILVIKKWDERKLSYEIAGQKRGVYIVSFFVAPGAAIAAIERDVNLSDDILRVLILKADHLNKDEMAAVEPQPIQVREERPSYDRPYGDKPYSDRPAFDRGDRPAGGFDRADRPAPRPRREEGEPVAEAQ